MHKDAILLIAICLWYWKRCSNGNFDMKNGTSNEFSYSLFTYLSIKVNMDGNFRFGHIGILGVIRDHKRFGKKNLWQKVKKKRK